MLSQLQLLLPEQATDKDRNGYILTTIHGFIRVTCPALRQGMNFKDVRMKHPGTLSVYPVALAMGSQTTALWLVDKRIGFFFSTAGVIRKLPRC